MRTRTLITSAAFMAVSAAAGTASAQLQLKGSDTLELVTKDVIAACPGANGNIVYIGGGSGTGQAAMVASPPTQHVAPMSRQMNNAASCTTNSRQLLIGLDGIVVVASNATGGDPSTCTDDIGGVSSSSARPTRPA
jgi:ABC-type phosphate transport system substrate-binding protein